MKLNKLALAKKQIEQMKKRGVKVKITACGKVMIDGLPFSFSVMSGGERSEKGIVVSFSGEAVENGTELPKLYFACGKQDHLYEAFLRFKDHAREIGLQAKFEEIDGYKHEWRFWDLCLQDALDRFLPEEEKTPVFDR